MARWLAVLLALVLLLLVACDESKGDDPPAQPDTLYAANNNAIIAGDQVGAGSYTLANLRQPLPVEVLACSPDLDVTMAYKARTRPDTTGVYWMIMITNTSATPLSGISATGISYIDSLGQPIEYIGPTMADLIGNVGVTELSNDTSCLAPGESGWLLGWKPFDYANLTSMRITSLYDFGEVPMAPVAAMTAKSYRIIDEPPVPGDSLEVKVENTGGWVAGIDEAYAILLDVDDTPLLWQPLRYYTNDGGVTNSGEVRRLYTNDPYRGAAGRMQVFVQFYDLPVDGATRLPTE